MVPQQTEWATHDEVVAFLADPASHGGAPVTCRETHISRLFLVGERAYKLKKPLRFPYLDFTSLAKRQAACEAELRLNQRTAPQLYQRVMAVTRQASGALALDHIGEGGGVPVEWLVVMTRFDEANILREVAVRDGLSRALLEDLAAIVAAFHGNAQVISPGDGQPSGHARLRAIAENSAHCYDHEGLSAVAGDLVASVNQKSRQALALVADLLDARQRAGRVRRCHGDLHLGNLVLLDGRPTPFDCIEFNDAFASIDVLYDLAFLLMDLAFTGDTLAATQVFNRYMDITGEVEGLAALPLMMSLRAGIRAHVGAAAARQLAAKQRDHALEQALNYLHLAAHYLTPAAPRLVAVGGLSGSGKSRLARVLSPHVGHAPGALVARSDTIRKRLWGVAPLQPLPAAAYAAEITERTYDRLYQEAEQALAAGYPVIADAVFAKPEQRAAIAQVAHRVGVPFTGLWVSAPPQILAERIARRSRNASDATVEILHQQLGYRLGVITWQHVDSGGSRQQTLTQALAYLENT